MQKETNNGTGPVRVALDAMGGDHGPVETVKGAVLAAQSANVEMILVGDQGPVEQELANHDVSNLAISIVPSVDSIRDDEHPIQALRTKPKASVVVATRLLKSGDADVVVSTGSTGASMASAVLTLGLMEEARAPLRGWSVPWLGPQHRSGGHRQQSGLPPRVAA